MPPIVPVLASVVVGVIGQLLLKSGVGRVGALDLRQGVPVLAWRIGTSPRIWSGLALYGVSLLFWLVALSRVELGFAYPFISLSYVLVVLASWLLFRERITGWRLLGVGAICAGVVATALG